MLFHLGSLWRLNEAGLLRDLACVSSVSGGSITAATLAIGWGQLDFGPDKVARNLLSVVIEPVRELARHTIDVGSIVGGFLNPFSTIADSVADAYRKYLFGAKTLQDLPDQPRFVINATNVQTGALWRFSKAFMGDYRVGLVHEPAVELAVAVGASSAFPPYLSPVHLTLRDGDVRPDALADLARPPFTTNVVLSDGGVYDNLGLEPVFKHYRTVLVSDGGGKMAPEGEPASDWARHSKRVIDLIDNQVRSLRSRVLIGAYRDGSRQGAYWGIRTDIRNYQLADPLNCPLEKTLELAAVPTRLAATADDLQERLINWGYGVCDAALRKHVDPEQLRPAGFPYPRGI
jgi:NTE family protein